MNLQVLPDPMIRLRHTRPVMAAGHAIAHLYSSITEFDAFHAPIEHAIDVIAQAYARGASPEKMIRIAASCERFLLEMRAAYHAADESDGTNEESNKMLESALGRLGEIHSDATTATP